MLSVFLVLTGILMVATLLPLSSKSHWIVRGFDFPRMQLFIFAILLLASQLYFLSLSEWLTWILTGATFFCTVWQFWWIYPYTPLCKKEVLQSKNHSTENQISIITSNVLTSNRNAAALVALVHTYAPDILVTLESDQWWEDQLKELEDEMPYTVKCPLDNLYGMHVYSRLPLQGEEVAFLVEEDVPSIHASVKLRTNDQVRVHFLHPAPPSPTENETSTERDVELIIVAKSVKDSTQPLIVTGDLNDVAWSSTTRLFRKISGLLDPRVGRGMFNTFHVNYPLFRWPLDHLFHSHHFTLKEIRRLPSIGSDHFPLYTSLVFTPGHANQEGLEAELEDKMRAREIVSQLDATKDDVPEPNESTK